MNGLCYQRTIWRCNIKRLVNQKNINDYLFLAENTTYGNKSQSSITYQNKLFISLNNWLYQLNKSIILPFNNHQLIKKYSFTEKMFSDIFCLEKTKPTLTFYNLQLLQDIKDKLSDNNKQKIIKNCIKNIELLTYDILALLNIYKHFEDDSIAIKYLKNKRN